MILCEISFGEIGAAVVAFAGEAYCAIKMQPDHVLLVPNTWEVLGVAVSTGDLADQVAKSVAMRFWSECR